MLRGQTSGRTDDNMETLQKRLNQYKNEQLPVIAHFESQGLVKPIDGNKSQDEVYDIVK